MASISRDKDSGITHIYFVGSDGRRRKVSLGKATKKQADTTKLRVEQLVQDQRLGTPHDSGLIAWINALPDAMRTRLEAAGLLGSKPKAATLAELIKRFLAARTVKDGTKASYKQCTDSLLQHFGADKAIDQIGAADADAWRAAITTEARTRSDGSTRTLARATVAKRVNIAKAIFSKARVWKLLPSSPFEHMKSGSQANPARAHYISKADAAKLIDACGSVQWQAIIGLARYAGLRCPSELRELKWTDINWERKAVTVRSPKTEANPAHAVRVVPVCEELQPILMRLFERAKEGAVEMVPQAHVSHAALYRGMDRIIRRAALTPWPKVFNNLRASCATDWASEIPLADSSRWLGHSPAIAAKHYLQPNDRHFKAVTGSGAWLTSPPVRNGAESGALTVQKAVQNRVQQAAAPKGTEWSRAKATLYEERGCASSCELTQPRSTTLRGRGGI
jgi:integrase